MVNIKSLVVVSGFVATWGVFLASLGGDDLSIEPASSRASEISDSTNHTHEITTTENKKVSLPLAKSLLNKPPPYEDWDIFRLSPNLTKSPNTIVSAYFRVASKHGTSQDDQWMRNFLSMQDHMVIFTQPELLPQMMKFRSHALERTVIVLMQIDDIPIGRLYPVKYWEDQLRRDPETRHASYQLFWIWLNKSWCVTEAMRHNFFDSDLYVWSDIGGFREGNYNGRELILHREQVPPHKMMQMTFTAINPLPGVDGLYWGKMGHPQNFYHSDMMAVAYNSTWWRWHEYFLDTVDRFLERKLPVYDDQVIMQSECFWHPEICAHVSKNGLATSYTGTCGTCSIMAWSTISGGSSPRPLFFVPCLLASKIIL